MRLHGNAALTPKQRLRLARRVVDEGWSLAEAAAAAEVSERTASKWVRRYCREGEVGLVDRASAPKRRPNATAEYRVEAIAALRRLRMTGLKIAECLGMVLSTVQGVLTRIGLGKLSRLEPPEPQPLAAPAARRADPRRRQEARPPPAARTSGDRQPPQPASPTPAATASPAGSLGTSVSTTPPGSPTSRCSATRRPPPVAASSSGRCGSTARTA